MYTETKAITMNCILTEDMFDELLKIKECLHDYDDILNEEKTEFVPPKKEDIEFLDWDHCIASSCKHWKFNEDQTHGWCGAMDG